jgi:hypothetical protein
MIHFITKEIWIMTYNFIYWIEYISSFTGPLVFGNYEFSITLSHPLMFDPNTKG